MTVTLCVHQRTNGSKNKIASIYLRGVLILVIENAWSYYSTVTDIILCNIFSFLVGWLVVIYSLSMHVGYLMPIPVPAYKLNTFDL